MIEVVADEEAAQTDEVHFEALGERERLADQTSQPLPESEVEPLQMVGWAFGFLLMQAVLREHLSIGGSLIGVTETTPVLGWYFAAQLLTREGGMVSPHPSHDLTCAAAQSNPNPDAILFVPDKSPNFVQFEHISGFLGQ